MKKKRKRIEQISSWAEAISCNDTLPTRFPRFCRAFNRKLRVPGGGQALPPFFASSPPRSVQPGPIVLLHIVEVSLRGRP